MRGCTPFDYNGKLVDLEQLFWVEPAVPLSSTLGILHRRSVSHAHSETSDCNLHSEVIGQAPEHVPSQRTQRFPLCVRGMRMIWLVGAFLLRGGAFSSKA